MVLRLTRCECEYKIDHRISIFLSIYTFREELIFALGYGRLDFVIDVLTASLPETLHNVAELLS